MRYQFELLRWIVQNLIYGAAENRCVAITFLDKKILKRALTFMGHFIFSATDWTMCMTNTEKTKHEYFLNYSKKNNMNF